MAQRKPRATQQSKGRQVMIYRCQDIKAALARELRTHVQDAQLRRRLQEALGGEVAYGTGGGGGGIGVA